MLYGMELQTEPAPKTPIFSGYFSDWSSACEASNQLEEDLSTLSPFNSNRWIMRQHEMLTLARQGIYPRPTNLPLLASVVRPKLIADFGGGSGWTSELALNSKLRYFAHYMILEKPSICKEFSPMFGSESGVIFSASMSEVPSWMVSQAEILYSNSVIQYFPDDSYLEQLVSSLSPKYILLDDFKTSTKETFFTLQNYHGYKIPYRFSNFESFVTLCNDLGYELQVHSEYVSPISVGMSVQIQGHKHSMADIGSSRSILLKKVS